MLWSRYIVRKATKDFTRVLEQRCWYVFVMIVHFSLALENGLVGL